ncbi:MAG: redox-regulated ATPase YchF, partial [Elusimicrobia bacterium]|nr:redox-regulated ATPase YchF [Elusimicrobiota bacterium]
MKVGIIGLEYAGKKSLFSLLTGIKRDGYQQSKEEIGVVNVPDERIEYLAKFYNTEKKTYSKIEFYLLPSIEKGSQEKSKALLEAKEVDMFAIVVRQFTDDNVFHPL